MTEKLVSMVWSIKIKRTRWCQRTRRDSSHKVLSCRSLLGPLWRRCFCDVRHRWMRRRRRKWLCVLRKIHDLCHRAVASHMVGRHIIAAGGGGFRVVKNRHPVFPSCWWWWAWWTSRRRRRCPIRRKVRPDIVGTARVSGHDTWRRCWREEHIFRVLEGHVGKMELIQHAQLMGVVATCTSCHDRKTLIVAVVEQGRPRWVRKELLITHSSSCVVAMFAER